MVTRDDLFNCAGWQANNRIGILAEMHNVFQQNYLELQMLFTKIHDEAQTSKETFKESWYHLSQRIFNYLSSAIALADQTSRMMKHYYKGTDIQELYDKKVSEIFLKNKCIHFIKKLRNYQTHFQITYPHPVRSIDDNKSWDIILLSDELLQHPEEWDQLSKNFIRECGTEINLNKTFSEYTKTVNSFHMWLHPILQKYHQKDFKEEKAIERALGIDLDSSKAKLAELVS